MLACVPLAVLLGFHFFVDFTLSIKYCSDFCLVLSELLVKKLDMISFKISLNKIAEKFRWHAGVNEAEVEAKHIATVTMGYGTKVNYKYRLYNVS